jgi:Asp-tRNA(Asn)/Glu-tRNA(Gln) amidotransferase A subunit family amidase
MTPIDAYATAAAIRAGRLTAVDAASAALAAIRAAQLPGVGGAGPGVQPSLNAFTVVLEESAMAAARAADARVARGETALLLGVPISVKDHIWMAGAPATNGSAALRDFVAPADCVAVARLRAAGAVIVGKTNNPEFCYRGITDNLVYGLTRNPRNPDRTPGGSSGGAGASVAAGLTHLALGTDGGGSIRIPAAFCGVVGHKPTFGLVPKEPGFKGWKSLSVDGPLATSVRDAALMLSVIAGPTGADDTTVAGPLGDLESVITGMPGGLRGLPDPREPDTLRGLRIAWSADLGFLPVDPEVRAAFAAVLEVVAGLGATMTMAAPGGGDPTPLWNTIALAEGYSSEGPLLERWRDRMSPGTAEIIEAGAGITAGQYVDALHERNAYTKVWSSFFDRFDVLLTPTMQLTAFPVGLLRPVAIEGRPVDPFFDDWCTLCLPANLTGMPATSIPCGTDRSGLPVGLQIMGPRWSDALTLRVGAAIERALTTSGNTP